MIQRMDNVAIVVDDLDAAVAFFTELHGHHRRPGGTDQLTRACRKERRGHVA